MKAIIFYITAILTVILLCAEVSFSWFILGLVNAILIAWCYNNITLREFIKYSGYSTWYKFLKV